MNNDMILSASGWRKIFASSNKEQDKTEEIGLNNKAITVLASQVFCDYIKNKTDKTNPCIICGCDSRPTGKQITEQVIKTLVSNNVNTIFLGITAAPEIMAYSKTADGFIYISASHNPVGHNGIKFGLNTGGVLNAEENKKLVTEFTKLCNNPDYISYATKITQNASQEKIDEVYKNINNQKQKAKDYYKNFIKESITSFSTKEEQNKIFNKILSSDKKISVVCDFNGSARCVSIDKEFLNENNIELYSFNDTTSSIVHEIIPEAENLEFCANYLNDLQKQGKTNCILGYMPDCDGDRGNIVYWDEKTKKAKILKAQEVFSLSVLSELSYSYYINKDNIKNAVAVNCPTSMRIEEIANAFNAKVFRAEVGEANVVNLAQEKRNKGYNVRILGEGSNGGTITYPSQVRDPLNTLFAIIKLLTIPELYKTWCQKTNYQFTQDYTITDILESLPKYTTTGVSEKRAILHINTKDHSLLKSRFQQIFEKEYNEKLKTINEKYGITSYKVSLTNGTKELIDCDDFSKSKNGGLKIIFYSKESNKDIPVAFVWMRGSGTEPVFRILCDVKGNRVEMEKELLEWETQMLLKADSIL